MKFYALPPAIHTHPVGGRLRGSCSTSSNNKSCNQLKMLAILLTFMCPISTPATHSSSAKLSGSSLRETSSIIPATGHWDARSAEREARGAAYRHIMRNNHPSAADDSLRLPSIYDSLVIFFFNCLRLYDCWSWVGSFHSYTIIHIRVNTWWNQQLKFQKSVKVPSQKM